MSNTPSRNPGYPINPIFSNRWSPRAMTGESLSPSQMLPLLEAARWAPSSGNGQPWRFLYALGGTPHFETFFDLLVPANQVWAKNAGALVVILSHTLQEHNGKPNPTHSYDTGAAWMSLALQGSLNGLVVHGVGGFDRAKARIDLGIPEDISIEAMAVIGHPAPASTLPPALQEREIPSQRKTLETLAFEGKFPN